MEGQDSTIAEPREQGEGAWRQIHDLLEREEFESALDLFNALHRADQAYVLRLLSGLHQQALLNTLTSEDSAKVLEHLSPEEAVEVFGEVETSSLSEILDDARPEVAADVLRQLPEERSQETLEGMEEAAEVAQLLEYAEESAGGVMTPEYLSVREDMTAANALDALRLLEPEAESVDTIFIVDGAGRLVGTLSVTRLALARPTGLVREIMDPDIISVGADVDQEESARLMDRYSLRTLPVVDEEQRLVGVILLEDAVEVLEEEATEDMYMITGIGGERVFGPLRSSVGRRLPWLYVNLATTILAALVISAFESTIAKVVTIAVFLPVIAGQGGIAGTQTLTLVIRSMALGDIPGQRGVPLLAKELSLGLVHGLLLGVVIGLIAFGWKGDPILGLIVGVAMVGNMLVAGLAGAAIPLLLRRFHMDPATGSAVIVTTVTDVIGFLLLLGIATILVNSLL